MRRPWSWRLRYAIKTGNLHRESQLGHPSHRRGTRRHPGGTQRPQTELALHRCLRNRSRLALRTTDGHRPTPSRRSRPALHCEGWPGPPFFFRFAAAPLTRQHGHQPVAVKSIAPHPLLPFSAVASMTARDPSLSTLICSWQSGDAPIRAFEQCCCHLYPHPSVYGPLGPGNDAAARAEHGSRLRQLAM